MFVCVCMVMLLDVSTFTILQANRTDQVPRQVIRVKGTTCYTLVTIRPYDTMIVNFDYL